MHSGESKCISCWFNVYTAFLSLSGIRRYKDWPEMIVRHECPSMSMLFINSIYLSHGWTLLFLFLTGVTRVQKRVWFYWSPFSHCEKKTCLISNMSISMTQCTQISPQIIFRIYITIRFIYSLSLLKSVHCSMLSTYRIWRKNEVYWQYLKKNPVCTVFKCFIHVWKATVQSENPYACDLFRTSQWHSILAHLIGWLNFSVHY